ncbi:glycosyl hydrolase family 3 [Synechococcus sp. RSCCF101]|nr:glycosyl hydrolase family 3 [Synechococcus sp. RSCCF101]
MSLRERIARLLVVRASGHLADGQRRYPRWELDNGELQQLLELGVGGVILLGGSAAELALRCRMLRRWAGGRRLLLCADVEEGVGQRFEGATWLPPPLGLERLWQSAAGEEARELAARYGACTARQARAVGLNWLLAPVCDVNNNPANPVINVRAWGSSSACSAELTSAFIRAAQAGGVLCCAKHFPGHGDSDVDSHLDLPVLPHDLARLEAVELPPFRRAIASGVASVMTAHLSLPALDPEQPATLSRAVLHDLLRQRLGFQGLVVTDALVMEAISARHGPGEAAVRAFAAGSDLLLMPADAGAALEALETAFLTGRLSTDDLEASLQRRQRALEQLPHEDDDGPDPERLATLEQGEDRALRQSLLLRSLEQSGSSGPARGPGLNLIRVDSTLQCPPLAGLAPAVIWPERDGWTTRIIDGRSPDPWTDREERPLASERLPEGPVLLQLFIRGNPFRGRSDAQRRWSAVVRQLQQEQRLAALIVYGSPYLWQALRQELAEGVAGVFSPGQMPDAQALCLQRLGWSSAAGPDAGFTD